jgi:ribonuclease BN (tRNA processing enzyme)
VKLTVLGSASGLTTPGLHHAAVAAETRDGRLLLDCGEGAAEQLIRHGLDRDALDGVAISHLHPDHAAGVFMVVQMLLIQRRTKPLTIFAPERPKELESVFDLFYTFPGRLPFELRILPMEALPLAFQTVTPIVSDHLENYRSFIVEHKKTNPMTAWSFRIDENGRRAIYTSDLRTVTQLRLHLSGTDLLLIDGQHPEGGEIRRACEMIRGRAGIIHGLSESLRTMLPEIPNAFQVSENETFDMV